MQSTDRRPLHEQLAEQRALEEEQYRESVRLSNFVRKLEYDELAFLNELKDKELSQKRKIESLEQEELTKFRSQLENVASSEPLVSPIIPSVKKPAASKKH